MCDIMKLFIVKSEYLLGSYMLEDNNLINILDR